MLYYTFNYKTGAIKGVHLTKERAEHVLSILNVPEFEDGTEKGCEWIILDQTDLLEMFKASHLVEDDIPEDVVSVEPLTEDDMFRLSGGIPYEDGGY
jgi:hypothetical protein